MDDEWFDESVANRERDRTKDGGQEEYSKASQREF